MAALVRLLSLFSNTKFWNVVLVVAIIGVMGLLGYKVLEKKINNVEEYSNCNVTQIMPKECPECPKEPAFTLIKLWRLRLFSVQ